MNAVCVNFTQTILFNVSKIIEKLYTNVQNFNCINIKFFNGLLSSKKGVSKQTFALHLQTSKQLQRISNTDTIKILPCLIMSLYFRSGSCLNYCEMMNVFFPIILHFKNVSAQPIIII
jgi:hypothetical protein